jgi:hypothetical protein
VGAEVRVRSETDSDDLVPTAVALVLLLAALAVTALGI